jgi:lipopolysaccharide biosynthesis regulator YciM
VELLAIDYRNPAFSIAMLLIVIATVALIDHLWGIVKQKRQARALNSFLSRFEGVHPATDYKDVLKMQPDSVGALLLLASIYFKSGEYSESMKIYIALLEIISDKPIRITVMNHLARVYYKAGFLQRSRDILLESLKLKARNQEALRLLLIVYEQMREYKPAQEALAALNELGDDVSLESAFLEANRVIHDAFLSVEKRCDMLKDLLAREPFLARVAINFLFAHNPKEAWKALKEEWLADLVDCFWELEKGKFDPLEAIKYPLLEELYTAKGWLESAKQSSIFEFDLMIRLGAQRQIATIEFEYRCEHCLSLFPVHFYRCPNCLRLGCAKAEAVISKNTAALDEDSANFY